MAKRSKRKPATARERNDGVARTEGNDVATRRMPPWLGATLIVAAIFWVYSPVFHGDWLWDDDWYITTQPLMRNTAGLWKFWFQPGSWVDYYPVSETLLWVEWHFFGTDTLGYHLVNISLHAVNALLVWRLLARLGLRKAWLGGLIFAVHPVAVDSVAWIAETKNTVALLFCLLSLIAWIDFDNSRKGQDYARALVFFVLAMLGKISVMALPAVLLLFAWWKRRRLVELDFVRLAPFVLVAVVVSATSQLSDAWYWQHLNRPHEPLPTLEPAARLVLAAQLLAAYFTHVVWPVVLLPVYPVWPLRPLSPLAYAPWLAVVMAWVVVRRKRAEWGGHALFGLGFFTLFLAPFLGFIVAPYMSFTWLMDHILYIPMIGLIGLFVAAFGSIEERVPVSSRILVTAGITLVAGLLALGTRAYASAFSDEATLWGYTVAHVPGSWLAQDNEAKALLLLNQPEEAAAHFHIAEQLNPHRAQIHLNYGRALVAMNRMPEGLAEYDTALGLDPSDPEIYNQKGVAFLQAGRKVEAVAQLEKALELRPRYAIGLENLGIALALSGRLDEAVDRLKASLQIVPNDPTAHVNLGRALLQLGRTFEADAEFRQALALDPDNAAAKAALYPTTSDGSGTAP